MAVPELQMNGWLSVPWAEYLSRSGTTQDAQMSHYGGNSAVMTIIVNYSDWLQASRDLLGAHVYNRETGLLDRQPPLFHPVLGNLHAERISGVRHLRFTEKSTSGGVAVSTYQYTLLTVRFVMPKWLRTLDDVDLETRFGNPRQEWQRFCRYDWQASSESFSQPVGNWVWTEGPANGDALTFPTAQRLQKQNLRLTWMLVPMCPGILDPDTLKPTNLDLCQNRVNSTEFLGNPSGTMLFLGYEIQPVENADYLAGEDFNDLSRSDLLCNVALNFSVFDPPYGGSARGWYLAPYRNGQWYKIGQVLDTGKGLVDEISFATLFTMVG